MSVRRVTVEELGDAKELIDTLGRESAKAQHLASPITSISLFRKDERIYLHPQGGILKVGPRNLFVADKSGLAEIKFLEGIGFELFTHMLIVERVSPKELAYDRPSRALVSFLANRFGLQNGQNQANHFFMSFFNSICMASDNLHHTLLSDPRVVTSGVSGMAKCLNSVDLFGRALAIDNAYRHMTSAEQYLLDAQKMQDTAPHTDVTDSSLNAIDRGKEWLRPYSVSPDNASCRDPPVCVVPQTASMGLIFSNRRSNLINFI